MPLAAVMTPATPPCSANGTASDAPAVKPEAAPKELTSYRAVVKKVLPAVVSIEAGRARGTGFHIRPDYVLTNAHVVEGQSSVTLQYGNVKLLPGGVLSAPQPGYFRLCYTGWDASVITEGINGLAKALKSLH